MVSLSVGDEEQAKAAIGNGPVDALFAAVDDARPAGLRLAPRARDVRDQGGLGRRGRPGPGARALPPLERRRPRRARGLRARVKHEHHRGVDRGLPRRRQQAPRRERRARHRRPTSRPGRRSCRSPDGRLPDRVDRGRRGRARGRGRRAPGARRRRGARRVLDRLARSVVAGGAAIDAYGTALRTEDLEAVGACRRRAARRGRRAALG